MTFALIAGTNPGTEVIVPLLAVWSGERQFVMQRAGGLRVWTDVLREIGPGCDRAWRLGMCQYAHVVGRVRTGGLWLTDGADGGHVEDDGEGLLEGWESG